MREKVVLIGAGSASFTRGLVADLLQREWDMELGLVDIDAEALAVAEGLARKLIQAKKVAIEVTASTDRREVLKGAVDVVINPKKSVLTLEFSVVLEEVGRALDVIAKKLVEK